MPQNLYPCDPSDLSAVEAITLIQQRKLSAEELNLATIQRVKEVDHAVNALVVKDFDRALVRAREADKKQAQGDTLGPLHGLTFGVKDMLDVEGLPTTFGSEICRDNMAQKDDHNVALMRKAGAIPIGKTNNPEWSAGGNTRNKVYGATVNPYDVSKSCGGSSGGSAVSIACGFSSLATGSDTGGSLRTPAAFCGVVGFRPSPGIVPGTTRPLGLIPLSTVGPMGRTVADCGLMLSVLSTADSRDPYTSVIAGKTIWEPPKFASLSRVNLDSLKFAYTENYGFAPVENNVKASFQRSLTTLTPFLRTLEEASPDCTGADRIFSVLRAVMFLGTLPKLIETYPGQIGANCIVNVKEGLGYSAQDVTQALIMQSHYYQKWHEFFEHYDYLLTPTVGIETRDWHELYPKEIEGQATQSYYHWLAMAYASTLAGHPSITIPCGTDSHGLPCGLQIVGKRYDDLGVLSVAAELEAIIQGTASLAVKRPDLASLRAAPPIREQPGFLSFE